MIGPEAAEGSGATVAEAVRSACDAAGWDPDQVEVEVVSRGVVAVPGEHLSGRPAQVRVRRLPPPAPQALAFLRGLLRRMAIDAEASAHAAATAGGAAPAAPAAPVLLEVEGDDLGVLIGWRGESLRALQTVVNLALGPGGLAGPRVIVDVARYRRRREEAVEAMALRWAQRVRRTGQPMTLDPMPPYERRAVHLALVDAPGVRTESRGADPDRRVTILPEGAADAGEAWSPP